VPFHWPEGSRILLYTDGLVEARNRDGVFFPLDDHLAELCTGTVDEALDRLLALLGDFSAGHGDDLALVLAEQGRPVPPGDQ
jgi:serine phosphatase RsbU (regulator of sigma subunit)